MKTKFLYLLIGLLLLPALFVNLGEMVFIDDEGIRALVAQEMLWSGDYLVPTLHGDIYLNKPPLWNWIQLLSIQLWGESSEWTTRFPTVVALLGFAATTFFFSRPTLGEKLAFVHAFTVITCGRMLFWDSMLGLIDVTFSWVVYTQFMLLWYYWKRGSIWQAFGWTYLLCAIGFMLKGMPAIAFTGITVIALLVWQKRFWALLSVPHLLSGLGCLGLLSLYYFPLNGELDITLVARRLFVESGKRTAVNHPWQETASHLLAFPFEMIYHFLPWTLLIVFLFRKSFQSRLKAEPTVQFWLIAFLVNLPLYWLSPNVYPRYLLMLFPLLFGVGLYFYANTKEQDRRFYLGFHGLVSALMLLFSLGFFVAPLHPDTGIIAYRWPLSILFGSLGLLIIYLGRNGVFSGSQSSNEVAAATTNTLAKANLEIQPTASIPTSKPAAASGLLQLSLLSFVAFLLLLRIVFNVFILPPRAAGDERGQRLRTEATEIGEKYQKSKMPLAIYGRSLMEPASSYYLEMAYGGIVPRVFDSLNTETAYIVNPWMYKRVTSAGKQVDGLYFRHQKLVYPILKLQPPYLPTAYTKTPIEDGMGTGIERNTRGL